MRIFPVNVRDVNNVTRCRIHKQKHQVEL